MDSKPEHLPFLLRLADALATATGPVLVVLPNKRSLHVLEEMLRNRALEEVQLVTVDALMQQLSGMTLMEPEELLVTFYRTAGHHEPFEAFLTWAVPFLNDANDIDLHLVDPAQLLQAIRDFHATGASFDAAQMGPMESRFLAFWDGLPDRLNALKQTLKSIKLAYRGFIYRTVAELAQANDPSLDAHFQSMTVWWVGIIPGNPSEQMLLEWLANRNALQVYADTDRYYLEQPAHEAGRLFQSLKQEHLAGWVHDLLGTQAKEVRVHPVTGAVKQLYVVMDLLREIPEAQWPQTAVVLADEHLLMPMLQVMEPMRDRLNITAGLPLRNTMLHRFVMTWVQLYAGARLRDDDRLFYHRHLTDLMEYPVVLQWLAGSVKWHQVREKIIKSNRKFVAASWLREQMGHDDLFAAEACSLLFEWPRQVSDVFGHMEKLLGSWEQRLKEWQWSTLEQEALHAYRKRLKLLLSQYAEVLQSDDMRMLRAFLHRQIGYSKLYLEQPENAAIQVMGMLETRMVDFKRVIVLGASEDALPGRRHAATHIPFNYRVYYGISTPREAEALQTYHFYRLLQRAERVDMVYSTESDALSSGEPSRFIHQMELEWAFINPLVNVVTEEEELSLQSLVASEQVAKTPVVIQAIKERLAHKVSPSALNTFVNSPLEFYYSYVLGVREQEVVEEEMKASTYGSAVHEVLEMIYTPYIGQMLDPKKLEGHLAEVDDLVITCMKKQQFAEDDLRYGKNLIEVERARMQVKDYLNFDVDDMRRNGPVKLIALEQQLFCRGEVMGVPFVLRGFADRIDRRNNRYRIIDYKSGKVEPKNLKTSVERLALDSKWSKALQLLAYQWTFAVSEGVGVDTVDACIYSFTSSKEGYMPLLMESETGCEPDEYFPLVMQEILKEMLDPAIPFEHRPTSKYTTF